MVQTCSICSKRVSEAQTLCSYHQRAYLNLRERYEEWKKALGLSWSDYLAEIVENPNTGEWVKEVAHHLLQGEAAGGSNSSAPSGSPSGSHALL